MSNSPFTVGIYTLGCKVNQYESEAIAEELIRLGAKITSPTSPCDAYLINTCTVTAESDRKARQFIRRAISKNPNAVIGVTGCLAQSGTDSLCRIQGIHVIVGNAEKLKIASEIADMVRSGERPASAKVYVSPIDEAGFEQMNITRFDRTRAYVKIEDGCENKCTYCIIPSARGHVRSKDPDCVINEVTCLCKNGCKEVVLTGIETASYGKDLSDMTLSKLLLRVEGIEGIGRVRLGSLDPSLISESFADGIRDLKSLAPHFHLSLQSGSSRILALMKRKYNADQAMAAIGRLRDRIPLVQFTTDVIVGFPDETEEDFEKTCQFVKEARFLQVHVFPYSKRGGTPAASMKGQIPEEVKKERLHKLQAIVDGIRREILEEKISSSPVCHVLFETYKEGVATGHTPEFIEVSVKSDRPLHAEIREVRLTHTDGVICYGELSDVQ